MTYPLDDTIAAIASAPGGAAQGIVRLSGKDAAAVAGAVFRPDDAAAVPAVRRPTVVAGRLVLPGFHTPIPADLYLWPAGRSYTGQPVGEIHTLGSWPLLEAAVRACCAAGARPAGPGEFTLRAFLAGRIDLTQAEAVLGVIDAADPAELETALAQLAGGLAAPLRRLRGELLDLLAHLEAGLDFADEDLTFITPEELANAVERTRRQTDALLAQMDSRAVAGTRVRVVLVGWPNAGKSSLFNALIGRRGALVSAEPGTTRDYLTAEVDFGGVPALLVDTAGVDAEPLGHAAELHRAAQAATDQQRRQAHVEVFCLDGTRPMNPWERSRLAEPAAHRVVVLTKSDAPGETDFSGPAAATSSLSGQGMAELREAIGRAVRAAVARDSGVVAGTAVRSWESVRLAGECLARAAQLSPEVGEELVAAELRLALEELGKVAGAVYTDDVLDRVFSRFCIGK